MGKERGEREREREGRDGGRERGMGEGDKRDGLRFAVAHISQCNPMHLTCEIHFADRGAYGIATLST